MAAANAGRCRSCWTRPQRGRGGTYNTSRRSQVLHPQSLREAFERHAPTSGDGCWIWRGNIRPETGYARLVHRKKHWFAHRAAYFLANGAIPDGLTVDHLCHNADLSCPGGVTCPHRACVRLDHLGLAPSGVNSRRASVRFRTGRCGKGHPISDGYRLASGVWMCRTCRLTSGYVPKTARNAHGRGICPQSDCGRLMSLRADGTLHWHESPRARSETCAGYGQVPAEVVHLDRAA